MSFEWTPHRFAGGALALDLANSVILRSDPARSIDRMDDSAQAEAFAQAASTFSAERALFGDLVPVSPDARARLIRLREAIDGHFRRRTLGHDDRDALADLLEATADCLRNGDGEQSVEIAAARSALRLLVQPAPDRMKICGNCGWLFLDASKNRSRTWCDMAVCGNRVKASRHYARKKDARG